MVNLKRMKGNTKRGGRRALGRAHALLDPVLHELQN
jgi:hypothetical protein